MEFTPETISTLSPEPTLILPILISILIPLVCFFVVLVLLRFSAKASWLTSIAVSMAVTTIPTFIVGIRILPHTTISQGTMLGIILLPAAICAIILVIQFFRLLFTIGTVQANDNSANRSRILKMVEEGKIQTEEGSELLEAMEPSSTLGGQE